MAQRDVPRTGSNGVPDATSSDSAHLLDTPFGATHGSKQVAGPAEAVPLPQTQLWRCVACRAPRQYGLGAPEWSAPRPVFLLCEGNCSAEGGEPIHTKHVFLEVAA